ncbi:hypothetical protein E1B28_006354 [Marasmius oreades]|uniref:Uncharacterized protein n=1 Tax=Marasmius oreades TaxID=181124 RepID=A0A9P7S762_9AGAR|nr:uncharacterized protein E1B28_006354 [Marasmius oreades]KAG7095631.1 hypothetical protein E1B28_006354 [Marasmius oreades]
MMHPPLPRPPLSPVGSDVSLSMKAGASWGSRSSENENLLVVDDLYNEAGLRIVWSKVGCNDDSEGNADKAEPGGVDGELGRIGDRVVSNLNSAGLSSKHIPLPDDAHGMVFLPRSHTLDTIEDMSEIQPFPSTASIMFLGTDEYKGEGPPPGGFASSSPNPSVPTMPPPGCVIRRLVPSFCSAQDSGVDLSYDPDVNSCMEADMSYSVDFAEVRSKDTISIASTKDHHEVREEASIFSSRPSLHCLPYPRSPGQMRPLSTVMMPEATLSDSPVSCSPTTFTRRNSFAHGKHDEKPGSNRSIPQTQSASAKNVQVFTPLGAGAGPTKRIHHVHPSIPPVSRFNRSRPSLPMTSPSVTKHRSRRCSLPATYRQAQNEGHCSIQRNSYAGRSASHNPPNELGMQTSPRSRRMSESWTLEEELTISVLNAMEFPRLDHGLCNGESGRTTTHGSLPNRREIQTSRTRRTALSIFGSIRRRTGDQGRVSTPFITPAVATASTEPSQGRKRRRSFLMKRQQRPTSSSEVAPPPSPKKALGKFLKKLRQLSGLASL